jgi:hypothetical protein
MTKPESTKKTITAAAPKLPPCHQAPPIWTAAKWYNTTAKAAQTRTRSSQIDMPSPIAEGGPFEQVLTIKNYSKYAAWVWPGSTEVRVSVTPRKRRPLAARRVLQRFAAAVVVHLRAGSACRNLRLLLILIGGLKVKAGTGVCSMPFAGAGESTHALSGLGATSLAIRKRLTGGRF